MKFTYKDKKTPIHRLHPTCIIIWAIAIVIGGILIQDPVLLSLLFLSTVSFVLIGKIVKEWFLFIKFAFFLSIILIVINMLASQHGSHVIISAVGIPVFGNIKLTLESLVFGIGMSLRLLLTISAFAILTLTINPDVLLQSFLALKFPYKTVITTSIATRFIPCLLSDLDNIQDSLKTRGYKINEGGFITRIKKRIILFPPLLSNSLDRSIQSAEAMESRGFGSKGKKTFYKTIQTTKTDYFFMILSATLILIFLIMWIFNIGSYEYYPSINPITISFTYVFISFLLVLAVISPAILSPVKKVIDLD